MRTPCALALLLATTAVADPPAPAAHRLRVAMYNVQLLPLIARPFNKRKQPLYRARRIGELLAARTELIGLNEVFDVAARRALEGAVRRAWGEQLTVVGHPAPRGRLFGGGLLLLSRLPVVAVHRTHFSRASRIAEYGVQADGLAAKGVLHARVGRGARQLDVFVTHLESKDHAARQVQYRELAAFVGAHAAAGRPALILGDMNTAGGAAELADAGSPYHQLRRALAAGRPAAPPADLWPRLHERIVGTKDPFRADGGRRLDYIWVSLPDGRLVPHSMRVEPFRDPRVVALSDHLALEASFDWR